MNKTGRSAALFLFGVVIFFKSYVIVIGQTKPVLVVLNKTDATMSIIDPATMKVTGSVATGTDPHEVVLSADGRTAFVANYGNQTAGNTLSVIDVAAAKELRRVDLSPLYRPHGIQMIGGKVYFTAETNRMIARYDPAANKIDWMMGTGQNASHMIAGSADQKKFVTANIGSDSVTIFEFQNVPPAPSKITHVAVGKQPEAVDLSPDAVFDSSRSDDTLVTKKFFSMMSRAVRSAARMVVPNPAAAPSAVSAPTAATRHPRIRPLIWHLLFQPLPLR